MAEHTISKPLLKLKLLESLRQGDFASLQELLRTQFTPSGDPDVKEVRQLILHYAVQVAPIQLIKEIISHWLSDEIIRLDINHQDADGNTPLHLAAYQSRGDVVSLLLDQPGVNDCITNNSGLQPIEMCKNLNIAQMMQIKRADYVAEVAQEFRLAFNNRDFGHLETILSNPRNNELLDINGMDPQTGDTVLHEFVKKKDVSMCRWILDHGGDPFKRDRKGRLPIDLLGKVASTEPTNANSSPELELKRILERAAREQSVIDVANNLHEPPTYKGYLRKWTNFAQGYRLRWFVLGPDGMLSYYKDQDDTSNACRGSLNMSTCYLHLDSSEKLKFEIIGGSDGTIRWHLKGNHPIETNRWVWAIQGAIRFAKDREIMMKNNGNLNAHNQLTSTMSVTKNNNIKSRLTGPSMHSLYSFENRRQKHHNHHQQPSISSMSSMSSSELELNDHLTESGREYVHKVKTSRAPSINTSLGTSGEGRGEGSASSKSNSLPNDANDDEASDDEYDSNGDLAKPGYEEDLKVEYGPHHQELAILQRSISIELTSLTELLEDNHIDGQALETIKKSLASLSKSFSRLNTLTSTRDKKLVRMLAKQRDVNNLWIKSVKDLELELIEKTERLSSLDVERKNLKKLLQRKLLEVSENSAITDSHSTEQDKNSASNESMTAKPLEEIADFINSNKESDEDSDIDEFFDAEESNNENELTDEGKILDDAKDVNPVLSNIGPTNPKISVSSPEDVENESKRPDEVQQALEMTKDVDRLSHETCLENGGDNKQEDKALPVKQGLPEENEHAALTTLQKEKSNVINSEGSYLGYEDGLRPRLKLGKDDRPKVSLWSVLKSMIGRDMTRMTLPVTFNEPTSLLQRVAEDLEYSDLLDEAASFEDSTLRMLYVAIFSASSYASTTKRVAKPFNPLLGETYEYARRDKHYRFFTEQVSHHPPISATWTESPRWDFWGESHVDSDFNGRTFEFKHLGLWYLQMRPDSEESDELYTWKKPNNTVVGILLGNPQVDNYGDVEITNHTTGDKCMIHFKARGWRASSAYEVKGEVYNSKGGKEWIFGGHWNEAIYAKKVLKPNSSEEMQLEKTKTRTSSKAVKGPNLDGTKFLVWHANPRPDSPFNLTSFAITLNAPQPHLLDWIARTDTRLRPDQRAMEEGRYDEAAEEKHRVEQKQRKARKEREISKEQYNPKWFVKEVHPVTKEKYWKYNGRYWKQRKTHNLQDCPDIF